MEVKRALGASLNIRATRCHGASRRKGRRGRGAPPTPDKSLLKTCACPHQPTPPHFHSLAPKIMKWLWCCHIEEIWTVCVCACVLLFDLLMKSKNWKQMMETKYFKCILWNKGSVWSWLSHPALISSLFLFFKTNFYLFHRPPCWLPGDNFIVVWQNTNEMYFDLYICGISLGRVCLSLLPTGKFFSWPGSLHAALEGSVAICDASGCELALYK